jgi:hypothetical protein
MYVYVDVDPKSEAGFRDALDGGAVSAAGGSVGDGP